MKDEIGCAMEGLFEAIRTNDFIMNCQGERNSWPIVKYSTMLVTVLETEDFKRQAAICLAKLGLLFEVFAHEIMEPSSTARDAMNDILIDNSDSLWHLLTYQSVEDEEFATASMVVIYSLIRSSSETDYLRRVYKNKELMIKLKDIVPAVLNSVTENLKNWSTGRLKFIAAFLLDMLLRNSVLAGDMGDQQSFKQQRTLTMSLASDALLSSENTTCRIMGGKVITTLR